MIWLAWRQFRLQMAIVYAVLLALAVSGPRIADLYAADVETFLDRLGSADGDRFLYLAGVVVLWVLPGDVGVCWGAPLIARALEVGTRPARAPGERAGRAGRHAPGPPPRLRRVGARQRHRQRRRQGRRDLPDLGGALSPRPRGIPEPTGRRLLRPAGPGGLPAGGRRPPGQPFWALQWRDRRTPRTDRASGRILLLVAPTPVPTRPRRGGLHRRATPTSPGTAPKDGLPSSETSTRSITLRGRGGPGAR